MESGCRWMGRKGGSTWPGGQAGEGGEKGNVLMFARKRTVCFHVLLASASSSVCI